jgi:hypothetical protein
MERQIAELNQSLASVVITIDGVDLSHPVIRLGDQVIPTFRVIYYRKFGASLLEGGRLYGPYWQNLPKVYRERIHLDGDPTKEIDHACLHPRLLHACFGHRWPKGVDAYDVGGGFDRKREVKPAWNRMINGRSRYGAIEGMHAADPGMTPLAADRLFAALEHRHAPVAQSFFTGPWAALQRLDSELMLAVHEACFDKGIVGLSIHDSMIVREADAETVDAIMEHLLDDLIDHLIAASKAGVATFEWHGACLPRVLGQKARLTATAAGF